MDARFLCAASIALLLFAGGCLAPADEMGLEDNDCPPECPPDYQLVEQCPAFVDCELFPDCEEPNVCAPAGAMDNDRRDHPSPGSIDCSEPVECPAASRKVDDCPAGETCTAISLCDEDVLCKEDPSACLEQPKCPDDTRLIDDCAQLDEEIADQHCQLHYHCSGPAHCLSCHDDLPEHCPEDTSPVHEDECDEPGLTCTRVDTCEATLHCASPCIDDPECIGELEPVDECDTDDPACLTVEGCDAPLHCQAPEEDCTESPSCPEEFEQVGVDDCYVDIDECQVDTRCGQFVMCLPEES